MSKKDRCSINFCVGSPDGPRSSFWQLWTAKSDVYLTALSMSGSMKVSLHEGGRCQVSFNSEFERKLMEQGQWFRDSRHIDKWTRTDHLHNGVTLVFRILIPTSQLRPAPLGKFAHRETIWVPPPSEDSAVEFAIFLLRPRVTVQNWSPAGTTHGIPIWKVILPDGNTLVLVYHMPSVSDIILKEMETILMHVRSKSFEYISKNADLSSSTLRFITGWPEADGSRMMLDLAGDTFVGRQEFNVGKSERVFTLDSSAQDD